MWQNKASSVHRILPRLCETSIRVFRENNTTDTMENTALSNYTNISEDSISTGLLMFQLIFQIVVFSFGVPGNCLILCVYWTKRLKTSTNVLIMALAWTDLSVCLLRIISYAFYLGFVHLSITVPLESTAIGTSIMLTAVIAADRFDCICRQQRRFFTPKRSKIAALSAFLISFFLNFPLFIKLFINSSDPIFDIIVHAFHLVWFLIALVMIVACYGKVYLTIREHVKVDDVSTTREVNCLSQGEESLTIQPSGISNIGNVPDISVLSTTVNQPSSSCTGTTRSNMINNRNNDASTSTQVIPDSCKGDISGQCEIQLKKVARGSHQVNPMKEEMVVDRGDRKPRHIQAKGKGRFQKVDTVLQRKTTKMLLITSVVFVLTWLPYYIFVVVKFADYGGADINPIFLEILGNLTTFLFTNNAVNPLIYGIANRRFRKDCREVLRKIKLCWIDNITENTDQINSRLLG